MAISSERMAPALAAARIAIGAGIWTAPELSMKALGFDPGNAQVRALARLAGTRDLALGALAAASAGDPVAARRMFAVNALVDAGDALAFGIAVKRREGIDRAAVGGALSAAAAAALGAWLFSRAQA
jgi:hypothetical protein